MATRHTKTANRNDQCLLLPPPRHLTRKPGRFALPGAPGIHFEHACVFAATVWRELGGRKAVGADSAVIRFCKSGGAPASLMSAAEKSEGYALVIAPTGITVWAATDAGHLYGAMTLRQLMIQYGRVLPCLSIADYPSLARRGIQLCFPQGHTEYRHAYARHLVKELARQKMNELYLYLESYFDFPSLPHMAGPGAMTPAQARSLDTLCREYNIRLIPMLNVLGHSGELLSTQKYHHLAEYPGGKDARMNSVCIYCTSNPEVDSLIDGMVDDLLDCFSADTIHIGGDEVSNIGECPRCRKNATGQTPLKRYLRYYHRVLDKLHAANRLGGMWGDMLLEYCKTMSKPDQARFLKPLRDKAIIYDWQYFGGSRKSLDLFTQAGVRTIACSSSHICFSTAVWPSQSVHQRALFNDAIDTGAEGGMSTSWGNFCGVHEEQFNYLHASAAVLLWSGTGANDLARGLARDRFENAFSLQRYGSRSGVLARYLHMLGDARSPIQLALAPRHGLSVRKCLYHTVNVLEFWAQYSTILGRGGFKRYARAVHAARKLWNALAREPAMKNDPYLRFHEGPLLMHEHLHARYAMTEEVYALYDKAAKSQYTNSRTFRSLLEAAAARVRDHAADFMPVERYLDAGHRALGFDVSTTNRVRATKVKMKELAALLDHLADAHRPLPAFSQLYNIFLSTWRSHWYADREHDWAAEPARFQRFGLDGPTEIPANLATRIIPDITKENVYL